MATLDREIAQIILGGVNNHKPVEVKEEKMAEKDESSFRNIKDVEALKKLLVAHQKINRDYDHFA